MDSILNEFPFVGIHRIPNQISTRQVNSWLVQGRLKPCQLWRPKQRSKFIFYPKRDKERLLKVSRQMGSKPTQKSKKSTANLGTPIDQNTIRYPNYRPPRGRTIDWRIQTVNRQCHQDLSGQPPTIQMPQWTVQQENYFGAHSEAHTSTNCCNYSGSL